MRLTFQLRYFQTGNGLSEGDSDLATTIGWVWTRTTLAAGVRKALKF